jgi:outer membrane lipopolysaccharide assembly protein LptE/RlpB
MAEKVRGKTENGKGKTRTGRRLPFDLLRLPFHLFSAVAVVLLVATSSACGYHLIGQSNSLPARLQKLCVTPFVNRTNRAELDQRLTEQVSQEWVRRGRFQLVSNPTEADVVMSGTVTSAASMPVQFDQYGRATQYQLTVVTDVQFVDRTGEKPVVLWRDQHFTRVKAYDVNVTTATAYDYFDQEVQAMDLLAIDYARGLVVTILEGF